MALLAALRSNTQSPHVPPRRRTLLTPPRSRPDQYSTTERFSAFNPREQLMMKSLNSKSVAAGLALTAGFMAAASPAYANVAASFSLPQTPCCSNLVSGVDGFDFTPRTDIVVTALGWYDHGGDGLNNPHPVGIYLTSTQQLVAPAVTVTSASPLDTATSFRFASIAPLTLSAGVTYTIVGFGAGPNWDPYVTDPIGGVSFDPAITYNRWRTAAAGGLQFPTIAGQNGVTQQLFFAANFMLTPVPEPATALLLSSGVLVLCTRLRRTQAK